MPIPTLRQHNQVTLPSKLTQELGFTVGTPLAFAVENGKIIVSKAVTDDETDWLTPEIKAEIEESEAGPGTSFDNVDDMLAHLNG